MEETMIFGALETLNEEAQEDALEERRALNEANLDNHSIDDRQELEPMSNSILGSYYDPSDIDVLYIKSPRESPLPPKGASLSSSIVDMDGVTLCKQRISQPIDIVGSPNFYSLEGSLNSSPSSRIVFHPEPHVVSFKPGTHPNEQLFRSSSSFSSLTSSLEKLPKLKSKPSFENKSEMPPEMKSMSYQGSSEGILASKPPTEKVNSPEQLEDYPSDDENTPLVSPTHSVPLPTDSSTFSLGSKFETTHTRHPFERQYSVQLPVDPSSSLPHERILRPAYSLSSQLPPSKKISEDNSNKEPLLFTGHPDDLSLGHNETIL